MSGSVELDLLHPGQRTVEEVAGAISDFIRSAQRDVVVAIYDFHVAEGGHGESIATALQELDANGVRVRMIDHDERVTDYKSCVPCPQKPPEYIDSLGLDVRPIVDRFGLMHHKYVVVDGERVLTGSMNWTDDAFTAQENCTLRFESPILAAAYRQNFEQLWEDGKVDGTGEADYPKVRLEIGQASVRVRPMFCPGRGPELAADIAAAVRRAGKRIRICSPVLTSGPILGALTDVIDRERLSIRGVVDGTMMAGVMRQWDEQNQGSWKPDAYRYLVERIGLSGKASTPWGPDRPHDYMHAKLFVCDDRAYVGSYNHSRSGEENAENVLAFDGAAIADELAGFADTIAERYAGGDAGVS